MNLPEAIEILKLHAQDYNAPKDLREAVEVICIKYEKKQKPVCRHSDEVLVKDSETTGRVFCRHCGNEREWNAY